MMQARFEAGEITADELASAENRGTPDEYITCWVDVSDKVDVKEKALRAHRSQIPLDWPWLTVPDDQKAETFGRESFVRVFTRVSAPENEDDLFAGLR